MIHFASQKGRLCTQLYRGGSTLHKWIHHHISIFRSRVAIRLTTIHQNRRRIQKGNGVGVWCLCVRERGRVLDIDDVTVLCKNFFNFGVELDGLPNRFGEIGGGEIIVKGFLIADVILDFHVSLTATCLTICLTHQQY